jgi:hypothetical protein
MANMKNSFYQSIIASADYDLEKNEWKYTTKFTGIDGEPLVLYLRLGTNADDGPYITDGGYTLAHLRARGGTLSQVLQLMEICPGTCDEEGGQPYYWIGLASIDIGDEPHEIYSCLDQYDEQYALPVLTGYTSFAAIKIQHSALLAAICSVAIACAHVEHADGK